jgi:hypothetical protein
VENWSGASLPSRLMLEMAGVSVKVNIDAVHIIYV